MLKKQVKKHTLAERHIIIVGKSTKVLKCIPHQSTPLHIHNRVMISLYNDSIHSGYHAIKTNPDIAEIRKTNPDTIYQLFGISKGKLLKQYYQNK